MSSPKVTEHAAERWDQRTHSGSVAPEAAWQDGTRVPDAEDVTNGDECRYHRPTETILVRRDHAITTVLLAHADLRLTEIVDRVESGRSGRHA